MTSWTIDGGRALVGNEITGTPIHLEKGWVVDSPQAEAQSFDARGRLVLPGIVDLHGDAFERQILPRPKVGFPLDVALMDTDSHMISNGITTAYHGLTISWEPGLRSLEAARDFVRTLARLRAQLSCDTRLHLRWETFALDAVEDVLDWLSEEPSPILAFNDHTTASAENGSRSHKIASMAERSGLTPEAYEILLNQTWQRRDEVDPAIKRVAAAARAKGAVLLAHDENSPEMRRFYRALGAVASEFPLNQETAMEARAAGEHTIFGAPNVVRGGSHLGGIDVAPAVSDGLCSVLASDYYYPSQLLAAFRLVAQGRLDLPNAWALVSANPAQTAGLDDRGIIAPGRRGDIIVVDDRDVTLPRVVACFVAGRKVYERR